MSPLLRGGLAVAGLAGAFAAGFLLKPVPSVRTVFAQPPAKAQAVADTPAPLAPEVDIPLVRPPVPAPTPDLKLPDIAPPPIHDPAVKAVTVLGSPQAPKPEPVDPLDAAGMAMIAKGLGIKTTIRDKNEPVPAVLVGAVTPPAPAHAPMGGPMPRLEPPPAPPIPTIGEGTQALTLPPVPPDSIPNPLLVNDRNVALDFEVTRSGTSSIKAVELWTTRDGSHLWVRTDRMTGCQSPFRTRLGSDGSYCFRLVFESESGMRTPTPEPGDKPDLRLELDTTPPKIADLKLCESTGPRDKVRIGWTMSDRNLDHRVRIEYSTDGRVWHAVVPDQGVPMQSRDGYFHDWTVPPGLPHRVMLRVTARDRAGNETTAEMPKQVSIDLVAPAGKVTGVRRSAAEVGPMPREVVVEVGPAPRVVDARSARPRTLVELLTDSDWKPSTATPDSCRWEPEPRAPRSPFDGAIDVVIPPDRPPAPVVAAGR